MRKSTWKSSFWCSVVCAGLLVVTQAANTQNKADKTAPTFKISESLRHESLTHTEGGLGSSATETHMVSKGKVKMEISFPWGVNFSPLSVDKKFAIGVAIGNLKMTLAVRDDPNWKEGNPGFTVNLMEKDPEPVAAQGVASDPKPVVKRVKKVLGKARVKWNLDKVTIQIEGNTPDLTSPVAVLYTEESEGTLDLETEAFINLSTATAGTVFQVPIQIKGEVKRKHAATGDYSGSVTTIELKGEGKPKN